MRVQVGSITLRLLFFVEIRSGLINELCGGVFCLKIEITTKHLTCPIEKREAMFSFEKKIMKKNGVIKENKIPFIKCQFDYVCGSCFGINKKDFLELGVSE